MGNFEQPRGRTIENQIDEKSERINYIKRLIGLGIVTEDDDIPESVFTRLNEIAHIAHIEDVGTAEHLSSIEQLVAKEFERGKTPEALQEEASDLISDLVEHFSAHELPGVSDEVIHGITRFALTQAQAGIPFIDALGIAIAERRRVARDVAISPKDIRVDSSGVVISKNERTDGI